MGWLGDFLSGIVAEESVDMMLVRDVGGKPVAGPALVDDECYVEFYVNSLRLRNVRKLRRVSMVSSTASSHCHSKAKPRSRYRRFRSQRTSSNSIPAAWQR